MIIAVHSYKGGTGKTLLSVNLATIFASEGKKVALLDLDFRAPSLCSILKGNVEYWMNDYLNQICKIENVLIDQNIKNLANGKIFFGFANPATEAIRESITKDRKWEMHALGRLLLLRTFLTDTMNFDHVIFDTSPGIQYSAINAILSSDVVLIVSSLDKSDLDGTQRMIGEFYGPLEKRLGIILNKVPSEFLSSEDWKDTQSKLKIHELPIIGAIPCSCELLRARGNYLLSFENIAGHFTKALKEIATKIEDFTLTAPSRLHSTLQPTAESYG